MGRAYSAFKHSLLSNDIESSPAAETPNADYSRIGRVYLTGHKGLDAHDKKAGHHDGVNGFVGPGCMASPSADFYLKFVSIGTDKAGLGCNLADFEMAVYVSRIYGLDPCKSTVFNHGKRSLAGFFRRLKEQKHLAWKRNMLQHRSCSQQHCHMAV